MLAVLGTALAIPALAQDNFPDVPENHWAYEAVENLKREGILVGYPDGTFKGPNSMTRYEFAVALNAAYQRLKTMHDGLASQVAEIRRAMQGMGGGTDSSLADRLKAVEDQLKGMGRLSDDVASMKKMADEFQKDLASLGVDVEAMKKDLAEMQRSMGMGGKGGIMVSGDANIMIHAGESTDGTAAAMGIDGRTLGINAVSGNRVSLLSDVNVYHEIATTLSGAAGNGPKWDATIVYGNLIGNDGTTATSGYGNQSNRWGGQPFREGAGDVYIQRFAVEIDNGIAGTPFKAWVGRLGAHTENSYLFQRPDTTPYFDNARWDSGDWLFDGAILAFNFGETSGLTVFGGRNANRFSTNGVELQPIAGNGTTSIGSTIGAEAKFGLGGLGNVSLAYMVHGENDDAGDPLVGADRIEVYGGAIKLNAVKGIDIDAGYGKSNLKLNNTNVNDNDNTAVYANLGYKADNWGLTVGYRQVESNYLAAGSWDRIGTNWSPTNIETFYGKGNLKLSDTTTLNLMGEFGETINAGGGIAANSDIASFGGNLTYNMNEFFKVMGGYEYVKVDNGANDITQKWFSLGFGYNMSKSSMLKIGYQYGDLNNGVAWGVAPAGNYKGHIVTTQLSIKF